MASSSYLACALRLQTHPICWVTRQRTTSSHLNTRIGTLPGQTPRRTSIETFNKVNLQFPRFSHLAIHRKQKKHPGHPINSIFTSHFTNLGAESCCSIASATNQHASSIYDASQTETPPSLRPRQRRNNKASYLACSRAATTRQKMPSDPGRLTARRR